MNNGDTNEDASNSERTVEGKGQFTDVLQKVVEYLKGEPLLLFVLGGAIILAAAGASGSQSFWALTVPLIFAVVGILAWVFLETRKNPESYLRAHYGITIDEPTGECGTEKVDVRGTYRKRPPDDLLRLFTVSIDGNRCWPQTVIKVSPDGSWTGQVYLGGTKPNYEIKIVAAIVGPSTRVWWNYYKNVGRVMLAEAPNVKRPVLEGWPPDAVAQATVFVMRVFDAGKRWDQDRLFTKLKQNVSAAEFKIAEKIFEWMRKDGRTLQFGTGREYGSVYPLLRPNGININPVYLSTDGKLWLQFGSLQNKPVFGALDKRRELMRRFGEIRGAGFVEADLGLYPAIPLSKIAEDPEGLSKVLSALNWLDDQIASR
jgi:hypothetical protein